MPDTLNPQADDQKLLAQVVDFYHRTLKETTEALDYLHSRGITTGEAIDHFHIGYSNRTLGLTLPSKVVRAGWAIVLRSPLSLDVEFRTAVAYIPHNRHNPTLSQRLSFGNRPDRLAHCQIAT